MDLFLINGQDGPSLSEMVDCDIKSASDIGDLGVGSYFGLGYDLDLPSLDFEEAAHVWPHPYTANSNSSFELDFFSDTSSSLMVNPNSIMPFVSTTRAIKKEIKSEPEEEEYILPVITVPATTSLSPPSPIKTVIKSEVQVVTSKTNMMSSPKIPIQTSIKVELTPAVQAKKIVPVKKIDFLPVNNTTSSKTVQVQQAKRQVTNKRHYLQTNNNESAKEYPKPAYSYSCLIAMALKNSRSGSLPVSEIYSFMCEHFPYFKTAPNGWKNSVRHNLSLNKCFEKIEKPQAPGACGAQRKGCLWAMNPAKIAKMDDEVAKWSRKDPSAIKKAMVYPENLELLERGEMKIGSFSVNSDEECDAEAELIQTHKDSGEESEAEEEEEEEDAEECEAEDDVVSTIDDDSEDEISRVPPSLQPFDSRIAHFNQMKHMNSLATSVDSLDESSLTDLDLDKDVEVDLYEELEVADARTLLGLDESAPTFCSESDDESEIAVPVQKRPRIQGNYVYQHVSHISKHNLNGFRSITVENP